MQRSTVWIDHHKAFILDYKADGVHEREFLPEHKLHANKEFYRKYYHDLALSLQDADCVLVTGPGMAKEEFKNHCEEHHPKLAKAIVEVKNMKDHPSREELLSFSNKFYKKYLEWVGL